MNSTYTVDILNGLLHASREGEREFAQGAKRVRSAALRTVLYRLADTCADAADAMRTLILARGGEPVECASSGASLGGVWKNLGRALHAGDDYAVLAECERGEVVALATYRRALESNLPYDVRAVVERHAQVAHRNHMHVRALRDAAHSLWHTRPASVRSLVARTLPEPGVWAVGAAVVIALVGWRVWHQRPRNRAARGPLPGRSQAMAVTPSGRRTGSNWNSR